MNSRVKTPWTKAVNVLPLEDYRLQIILEDGQEMLLDLKNVIVNREIYWRLKNSRYFRQAQIDPLGGIFWPEGEDLAPDGLERYLAKD
ncbi:DUF2442 domain-containing protein [Synechocystis salina LEGE 06155]|nr:DUF2442 domain-containing protein [Synechocystis salina LEGE 06155]